MRSHASWWVAAAAVLAASGCAAAPGSDPPASEQPWAWELPECVGYQPAHYQAPAHRQAVVTRSGPGMIEHVERYLPGWGEQAVAEIRAVIAACASYEYGGSGDPTAYREQQRLVEAGFAGDESLLVEIVRQRPPDLTTEYAVVVRDGDLVVTIRAAEPAVERARCLARDPVATCPPGQA